MNMLPFCFMIKIMKINFIIQKSVFNFKEMFTYTGLGDIVFILSQFDWKC